MNNGFGILVIRAVATPEGVEYREVRRDKLKGGFNIHKNEVQRLQEMFDKNCTPQRAYVVDGNDVPVFAGAQLEDDE